MSLRTPECYRQRGWFVGGSSSEDSNSVGSSIYDCFHVKILIFDESLLLSKLPAFLWHGSATDADIQHGTFNLQIVMR